MTDERLDLNAAGTAELVTLSGVGPVLAERIVAARPARGGFTTGEELRPVPGVGDGLFARLAPRVRRAPPHACRGAQPRPSRLQP